MTPERALVERAREVVDYWYRTDYAQQSGLVGAVDEVEEAELGVLIAAFAAEYAREQASIRQHVCEAHIPLGEPGNQDDNCPYCEVVRLREVARLAQLMADHGGGCTCDAPPDTWLSHVYMLRQALAAVPEAG